MEIVFNILGILLIVGFLYLFFLVITALYRELCKECPHRKECEAHEHDKDFVPYCHKIQIQNQINTTQL